MERLSILIDETLGLLFDTTAGARGLYITCYLMAGQRCGDEIESGKVIFFGREPTHERLADLMKCSADDIKAWMKELVDNNLMLENPMRIKQFKKDHDPFIRMRQGGKQGVLKGLTRGSEGAIMPQDKIRKDKKRKDKLSKEERLDAEATWPRVKFKKMFKHYWKDKASDGQINRGEAMFREYGEKKLFGAMERVGGDYGFRSVMQVLKGEWDKPKGEKGKDDRHEVDIR